MGYAMVGSKKLTDACLQIEIESFLYVTYITSKIIPSIAAAAGSTTALMTSTVERLFIWNQTVHWKMLY